MTLICCEVDILRDQAIYFMDRLLKANVNNTPNRAKLILMREYVHGSCTFDMKGTGVDEYRNGTRIII